MGWMGTMQFLGKMGNHGNLRIWVADRARADSTKPVYSHTPLRGFDDARYRSITGVPPAAPPPAYMHTGRDCVKIQFNMKTSVNLADAFDEVPLRGTTSICYPSPSCGPLTRSNVEASIDVYRQHMLHFVQLMFRYCLEPYRGCMVLITKSGFQPARPLRGQYGILTQPLADR